MSNSTIPTIQPYTVEPVDPAQEQNFNYDINNYQLPPYPEEPPKKEDKPSIPIFLILLGLGFLGLMIFGALLLFGGGSSNNTNNNNNGGGTTTENITLQWWGVFLDSEVVQPLIDEYKQLNPNVTIEYANRWPGGSYAEAELSYKNELNRILNTNDPVALPDIFMINNTWAGDYEAYVSASPTLDIQTYASTFVDAVVEDFAKTGVVTGLPLWIDTFAVVYNKEMLATEQLNEPPDSWPRFKNAAQALTKTSNNIMTQAGFAAGTTNNTSYWFELALLLLRQNGVAITDENNQPIFSADPDSSDALNFFKSFATTSGNTWNTAFNNESAAFLEGKVAMIIVPSFRLRDIIKYNEEYDLGIDIGIAKLPQIEGQDQPLINWSNYWGNMVSRNRPYAAASWAFLNWLSQPEQQIKLSNNVKNKYGYFGLLYPRKDMLEELRDDQFLSVFNESVPFAQSWNMVKGIEVKSIFKELLDNTTINASAVSRAENQILDLITLKGILSTE